jgi:hypothetical protein
MRGAVSRRGYSSGHPGTTGRLPRAPETPATADFAWLPSGQRLPTPRLKAGEKRNTGYLREVRSGPRPRRKLIAKRPWYSLSRRAQATGAAKRPRATQTGAAKLPPSAQSGRSRCRRPSASGNSAHIAERVNLEVVTYTRTSSGALAGSHGRLTLIREKPNREGLQNRGGTGALRSCFVFERALLPLVARGPARAAGRPGGASRLYGAWGEGNGAAAEHEEGDLVLRSFNRCGRRSAYREKVVSCGGGSSLSLRP